MAERGNTSRAEMCAQVIQDDILDGRVLPGQRLSEQSLCDRLDVSRNTLRESFRLLGHDGLVRHCANRGVFVAIIDDTQCHEIYAARRHLELGALDELDSRRTYPRPEGSTIAPGPDPAALAALRRAADAGVAALAAGDANGMAIANNQLHLAIVALTGNRLTTNMMRSVISLTRLRFLEHTDLQALHGAYVDRNAAIAELIEQGHVARARTALEQYLLKSEEELLAAPCQYR